MSWINSNFQPNGAGLWQQNGFGTEGGAFNDGFNMTTPGAGDGFRPTWWGSGVPSGGSASGPAAANGILGQILCMLQQLVGSSGGNASGYGAGSALPGATFQNATLSSTGDPHLAVNGTLQNTNGTTSQINDRFDSMSAHGDLLSTNDFGDHFRVSTTVTQSDANGVTYNASATARMNHGRDSVTMGTNGGISVVDNGSAVGLSAGGTVTLSGGEVVSEAQNGAVSISEQNGTGQSMTTTFTNNGRGVDVSASVSGDVTLGGDLVRHATRGV